MHKIKVLIVEDEVIVAKDIAYYLEELGCEVIGLLIEGEDVMPFLKKQLPDLILMDITLRGKLNGVQTVQMIKKKYDLPVIFLTANTDDRSFEFAKSTKPFAFIEKPFKPKRLIRTVKLLIAQMVEAQATQNDNDAVPFVLKDRIFVRDKGKMTKILLTDILYIEADGAYSKIFTREKSYVLTLNLRNLENKIAHDTLMRVHRSYIVNLQKIDSMEENYIHIHQKGIPVSRSYWNDFLKRLNVI